MSTAEYREVLERIMRLTLREKTELLTDLATEVQRQIRVQSAREEIKKALPVGPDGKPIYPPGWDPELEGLVNPLIYGKGKILGDIISPIEAEWEACK